MNDDPKITALHGTLIALREPKKELSWTSARGALGAQLRGSVDAVDNYAEATRFYLGKR
jgi:hypothetical protein